MAPSEENWDEWMRRVDELAGFSMGFLGVFYGFSRGFPISMDFLWVVDVFSKVFQEFSRFLSVFKGFLRGSAWG